MIGEGYKLVTFWWWGNGASGWRSDALPQGHTTGSAPSSTEEKKQKETYPYMQKWNKFIVDIKEHILIE